jgi:hypothetical protein
LRCDSATELAVVEGGPADVAIFQFTFFFTSGVFFDYQYLLLSMRNWRNNDSVAQCLCVTNSPISLSAGKVYSKLAEGLLRNSSGLRLANMIPDKETWS